MKVSTSRAALFTELQTVTRAASTRSAVQALSGVQLQAKGGAIELRATDMEIGLRVPLEGEVVREGAVVLPARLLGGVARALPSTHAPPPLRLGHSPPLRGRAGDDRLDVPGPALVETVLKVGRAASRDETRPVLTGLLVSAGVQGVRMAAAGSAC